MLYTFWGYAASNPFIWLKFNICSLRWPLYGYLLASFTSHLARPHPPGLQFLVCDTPYHIKAPRLLLADALLSLGIPGRQFQRSNIAPESAMVNGIRTRTPLACASTPTINGRTAAPQPPKAAANPMALTCKCFGKSFVVTTTTAGNNGPRKNPCRDIATAPA